MASSRAGCRTSEYVQVLFIGSKDKTCTEYRGAAPQTPAGADCTDELRARKAASLPPASRVILVYFSSFLPPSFLSSPFLSPPFLSLLSFLGGIVFVRGAWWRFLARLPFKGFLPPEDVMPYAPPGPEGRRGNSREISCEMGEESLMTFFGRNDVISNRRSNQKPKTLHGARERNEMEYCTMDYR